MSRSGDALHIERELAITQPVMPSPMLIRRFENFDFFTDDVRRDCFAGRIVDQVNHTSVERHDRAQLVGDESDRVAEIERRTDRLRDLM
jgi:hypothetical protein